MPTICSITGAELPKNKIDGINVLDALKNNNMADLDDRFFYYHKGEKLYGVRQGKWKYLAPSTYNEILSLERMVNTVFQHGKKISLRLYLI